MSERERPESGNLLMAPLRFICNDCGTETVIYVSPDRDDEGLVIEAEEYRDCGIDCEECGQETKHTPAALVEQEEADE